MVKARKKVSSTTAILLITLVSLLVGFILFRNANPLADTTQEGIDTLQKLDMLEQELEQSQ